MDYGYIDFMAENKYPLKQAPPGTHLYLGLQEFVIDESISIEGHGALNQNCHHGLFSH